jgi:SAM-dependent methyltransferase
MGTLDHLKPGDRHYRSFVGHPEKFDIVSAMQFNLLTFLGLREFHKLLDIGCGSLRAGRLFIPYLNSENYFGIEPEKWLVQEGIQHELGKELIDIKKPSFLYGYDFPVINFGQTFNFVIAQSIFSHSSPNQIIHCLNGVQRTLASDGLFAATFVHGETDYNGTDWVYPECIHYTEQRIHQLAAECDLAFKVIDWPHPAGQTWGLFAHKNYIHNISDPTYNFSRLKVNIEQITINQVIENPLDITGYIDNYSILETFIFVSGWAREPLKMVPAKEIVLLIEDKIVGHTITNIDRKDVADSYDDRMLKSGWEIKLSKSLLKKGLNTIKAYIYIPDENKVIKLQNNIHIDI